MNHHAKHFLLIPLLLLTAACVPGIDGAKIQSMGEHDAILLLDQQVNFDGTDARHCHLWGTYTDAAGTIQHLSPIAADRGRTKLMQVTGGSRVFINSIYCSEFKVLYTKSRRKNIVPPLAIDVQAGTLTYPGTVVIDWESEGTGLGDVLINGAGAWMEDDGVMVMRIEDRTDRMLSLIQAQNPAILQRFTMTASRYEDHPNLIQTPAPAAPIDLAPAQAPASQQHYLAPTPAPVVEPVADPMIEPNTAYSQPAFTPSAEPLVPTYQAPTYRAPVDPQSLALPPSNF